MNLLKQLIEKAKIKKESLESFQTNEVDDMGPGNIPKGARNE